jgi:hypothetical protein
MSIARYIHASCAHSAALLPFLVLVLAWRAPAAENTGTVDRVPRGKLCLQMIRIPVWISALDAQLGRGQPQRFDKVTKIKT